ncbi:YraN family protein [Persephonella sp.]
MFARKKGKESEDKAVEFLKNAGYRIIERNFRSKFGEIDIIAENDELIVIVEVRSKTCFDYGYPEETVDHKKIKKLIKTTQIYLSRKNLSNKQVRFDIISIVNNNIFHIKNAFDLDY